MDAAGVEIQVLDGFALLSCAQDDAEWRLLYGLALVTVEPAQVQLHLAGVGRFEVAYLQLDRDESLHTPMEEEEVEVVVVVIDCDALLPLDEGETGSELEEKTLELSKDGGLEILSLYVSASSRKSSMYGSRKTSAGESSAFSCSAESSSFMSASGFFERAVRSKSMLLMRARRARTLQPSNRHIST